MMSTSAGSELDKRISLILDEIERVIVGKRSVVKLSVAALLAGGHILLEDVPGVGKTTLAKSIARSLNCSFNRVQFTPDLLPADVTGTSIFNQQTSLFEFRAGPVFTNIILADEINRATPKVQSSLLECMEESQVTVDGVTRELPSPFFVIATQNNVEHHSTYPLPEAQLDRFIIRTSIGYPTHEEEINVLDRLMSSHPLNDIKPVVDAEDIVKLQERVRNIHVDESLKDYIVSIVAGTRNRPETYLGASPRGSLALLGMSRALAVMDGRDYVLPDDIKASSVPVLAHRLILSNEAKAKRVPAEEVVRAVMQSVPVPVRYE